MVILVVEVLLAMSVVMTAGWAFQRAIGNAGWVDVFWTFGTGITCAAAALSSPSPGAAWRPVLIAVMVLLWSCRLGLYVALRVASSPEDIRYAHMRGTAGAGFHSRMFALLIVQAPVTALFSIAVIFAARQPAPQFRIADLIGVAILAVGIAGETLADRQMKQFKAAHPESDKVCDAGLWAISRHPNYLFEFIGWLAYPIIGITLRQPWSLLALIAPALMYLVLRYASGVPMLEAAMLRRKGAAYAEYQSKVGMIFPKI